MPRSLIPSLFGGVPAGRPADLFAVLQQQVNRLFEDVFRGSGAAMSGGYGELATAPRLNISETEQEFRIEAELPGVSENDVEVTLNDDILTIRGEKKAERSEEQENYHVMERSYGAFVRSVRMPYAVNAADVSASCENGVLNIIVPKKAVQETAHRIAIGKGPEMKSAAGGQQASAQGSQTTH